jgi:hypothetical protein
MMQIICQLPNTNIDWATWLEAFAGVAAAFLLWRNLIYQRKYTEAQVKATQAQIEINNRDYQRYIDEILPDFKFTFEHNFDIVAGKGYVEVTRNSVLDFYIKANTYDCHNLNGELQTARDVNAGATAEFSYNLRPNTTKEDFEIRFGSMYGPVLRFELYFRDKKGLNQYKQTLIYSYNTNSSKLSIPEKLSPSTI